jgi:hypothetical protein
LHASDATVNIHETFEENLVPIAICCLFSLQISKLIEKWTRSLQPTAQYLVSAEYGQYHYGFITSCIEHIVLGPKWYLNNSGKAAIDENYCGAYTALLSRPVPLSQTQVDSP